LVQFLGDGPRNAALVGQAEITAVFWESLILESSVVSSQYSAKKGNKSFCFFSPCALFPPLAGNDVVQMRWNAFAISFME